MLQPETTTHVANGVQVIIAFGVLPLLAMVLAIFISKWTSEASEE